MSFFSTCTTPTIAPDVNCQISAAAKPIIPSLLRIFATRTRWPSLSIVTMGDELCGPSNGLRSLKQHVDRDQSLQQTRILHGTQDPRFQGFRSTPNQSDAAIQFNAFQHSNELPSPIPSSTLHLNANQYPVPTLSQNPLLPPNHGYSTGPVAGISNMGGSWVNDFQSMQLSQGQPAPQNLQHTVPGIPSFNSGLGVPARPYFPQYGPAYGGPNTQSYVNQQPVAFEQPSEQIDLEFDNAMNDWLRENGTEEEKAEIRRADFRDGDASTGDLSTAQSVRTEEASRMEIDEVNAHEGFPQINDEAITHTQPEFHEQTTDSKPATADKQVDTELARAAQDLVDSVANNESEKFRSSKFLQMMRRIAAKEVAVHGNDLVETNPSASATSGGYGSHATGARAATPGSTGHSTGPSGAGFSTG
ncbi:hypothetical protein F5Y15DRAFT_385578 [Xylariaceae sp. FL0016]|nr:hypothetical protein F5Y15DRAFT_385578 [Xylariaceae sp. FL0016]